MSDSFAIPRTVAHLLCLWDFPNKNTRVGSHFLLQGIFLTQGSNPCLCLLHWQADSLPLSHLGNTIYIYIYHFLLILWILPRDGTSHSKHPFQQHKRQYYTWMSLNGQYRNQIDYSICSQRWRSCIQSTKTRPGADCSLDHQLFIAK